MTTFAPLRRPEAITGQDTQAWTAPVAKQPGDDVRQHHTTGSTREPRQRGRHQAPRDAEIRVWPVHRFGGWRLIEADRRAEDTHLIPAGWLDRVAAGMPEVTS